jgi:hypothetical protein
MDWKNNLIFKIPDSPSESTINHVSGGKKLLIITDLENFGEEEEISLKRLISSLRFDFEQDVNHIKLHIDQAYVVAELAEKHDDILIFGLDAERLGFNIDHKLNVCLHFESCRLLISDSFKAMNADKSKKTILWSVLKEMYAIV